MALNAYLKLKGQKSGDIDGSVTQKGREKSIMVIAASHLVTSPRDPQSGLPTGVRQHKPFLITKEVDASSPALYNVLCTNENIVTWKLQFWRPSATGQEVQYFTVELANANIASIELQMLNNKVPELAKFAEREEISFTYQKITWTWNAGGRMATDDWEERV